MYPINLALKELPSSPTVTFTVRLLVLAATVVFWIPSGAISTLLTGTMHGWDNENAVCHESHHCILTQVQHPLRSRGTVMTTPPHVLQLFELALHQLFVSHVWYPRLRLVQHTLLPDVGLGVGLILGRRLGRGVGGLLGPLVGFFVDGTTTGGDVGLGVGCEVWRWVMRNISNI